MNSPTLAQHSSSLKWRTMIGLGFLYAALFLEIEWIWGVLLLFWVIPDIYFGHTYFIEPILRPINPFLFWIIILTWMGLGGYMLAEPLLTVLT